MTVWVEAADSVTVRTAFVVPELPSVTVTSLIESATAAASSLRMVPVAWLRAMPAFVAPLRLT